MVKRVGWWAGLGVAGLSSDPECRAGEGNQRNDDDDDVRKERLP